MSIVDSDGKERTKMNYAEAFGFEDGAPNHRAQSNTTASGYAYNGGYNTGGRSEFNNGTRLRPSYDENIRLAPYSYGANQMPSEPENMYQQAGSGTGYVATPSSSSSDINTHVQYPPDPKVGWAR